MKTKYKKRCKYTRRENVNNNMDRIYKKVYDMHGWERKKAAYKSELYFMLHMNKLGQISFVLYKTNFLNINKIKKLDKKKKGRRFHGRRKKRK